MKPNNQASQLKKEVTARIIKAFYSDNPAENVRLIPFDMRPKGYKASFRCCVYKERVILQDRIIANLGFSIEEDKDTTLLSEYFLRSLSREEPDSHVLTVLGVACKGCVPNRIFVTELCQGCLAKACLESCRFDAITIENGKSIIDSSKCKNCGLCMQECPYNAIVRYRVPCEESCPVKAITKDEEGYARIDFDTCISCGKCLRACPFGAVHEKSQIIDVLQAIQKEKKVVALLAPAIVGQMECSIYQLKSAFLKAGFYDVLEVAQGADITAKHEAQDFEKRMANKDAFMTTSCCAAYNELLEKHLPEMKPFVSDTKTPLHYTAETVKQKDNSFITVFVSPCVAKRKEGTLDPFVDYVINFEEAEALFQSLEIDLNSCLASSFESEASQEGRGFPITGGVATAVQHTLSKNTDIKPYCISGLTKQSIKELKKFALKKQCEFGNLIEIMSCEGGCIGGNACLTTLKVSHKKTEDFIMSSKHI